MIDRSDRENKTSNLLTEVYEIPRYTQEIMPRPQLDEILTRGIEKKIIVISAPVGFGKTTLVSDWIRRTGAENQVGWVTLSPSVLSEEDFWSYLLLAIQKSVTSFGLSTAEFLQVFRDGSPAEAINLFINHLKNATRKIILVLDNFHQVSTAPFLDRISYFIDNLPSNSHLILLGRVLPAIRFTRLLAQQELILITPEDLSLSLSETRLYIQDYQKTNLDAEQIQKIHHLSEGWIVGIIFLVRSLLETKNWIQQSDDSAWISQSFFDFLEEEILIGYSASDQELINTICCLSDITSTLCDDILERSDSSRRLTELSRALLFLQRNTQDDSRYRINRLFSTAVQKLMIQNNQETYQSLIEKAALWSEKHGQFIRAIEYYSKLERFEKAASLLDDFIMKAVMNYDQFGLIEILDNLPDQIITEKPNTGIYYAMAFFLAVRINEIEPVLNLVEEVLNTDTQNKWSEEEKRLYRWKISVVRLSKGFRYDNVKDEKLLQEISNNVPAEDAYLFGIMNHTMAEYHLQRLEFDEAANAFIRGVDFAGKHQILHGHVFSLCGLARIYKEQGRLKEAEWHYGRALKLLRGVPGYVGAHALIRSGLAEIFLLRNELEDARRLMQEIILPLDDVELNLNFWYEAFVHYLRVGNYHLALRNLKDAQKCLDLATRLWQKNSNTTVVMPPELIFLKTYLWIDQDRIEEGKTWFDHRIKLLDNLDRPNFAELTAYGQLLLSTADPDRAFELLDKAEKDATKAGFVLLVNQIAILKSICLLYLEKPVQSNEEMERAIQRCLSEQIIEPFINKGFVVYKILKGIHDKNMSQIGDGMGDAESLFLDRIILTFEQNKKVLDVEMKKMAGSIQLVNGELSNRELEILSLLVRGKTIKEISSSLMISMNTTKSHLKSIYRKFGEHKNKDVIRKALEFGLVE